MTEPTTATDRVAAATESLDRATRGLVLMRLMERYAEPQMLEAMMLIAKVVGDVDDRDKTIARLEGRLEELDEAGRQKLNHARRLAFRYFRDIMILTKTGAIHQNLLGDWLSFDGVEFVLGKLEPLEQARRASNLKTRKDESLREFYEEVMKDIPNPPNRWERIKASE